MTTFKHTNIRIKPSKSQNATDINTMDEQSIHLFQYAGLISTNFILDNSIQFIRMCKMFNYLHCTPFCVNKSEMNKIYHIYIFFCESYLMNINFTRKCLPYMSTYVYKQFLMLINGMEKCCFDGGCKILRPNV